jgi:hypothetical protein
MANPIRGEIDFPVDGEVYRLKLSINSIIEVEDILDIGIVPLSQMFNDPTALKAGNVRAMLWGALREYHPEIDLLAAGDIMTKARLQPTILHVGRALQAAFPSPEEGKESPSPKRGQAGTGKPSMKASQRSPARTPKPSGN